jgi:hypothetical protein
VIFLIFDPVLIHVHRHSYRVLTTMYGSASIHLDKASPLVPILTAPTSISRGLMTDQIEITGSSRIIASISPDAGHNLYLVHKHQLMDWITLHVTMGEMVWPAMMRYYDQMGMTLDDLDPASVYRQWFRHQNRKKSTKGATNAACDVLKKLRPRKGTLDDVLEDVAMIIHQYPDTFYTLGGRPDPYMIRKAIMHTMHLAHGWRQTDIVAAFGVHKARVSRSISSFPLL